MWVLLKLLGMMIIFVAFYIPLLALARILQSGGPPTGQEVIGLIIFWAFVYVPGAVFYSYGKKRMEKSASVQKEQIVESKVVSRVEDSEAIKILKAKFANGEISQEEYEEKKKILEN